jgi:hypothetical protein
MTTLLNKPLFYLLMFLDFQFFDSDANKSKKLKYSRESFEYCPNFPRSNRQLRRHAGSATVKAHAKKRGI